MKTAIVLVILGTSIFTAHAGDVKTATKVSKVPFDLPAEVKAFVKEVIEKDGPVAAEYEKRVAPSKEAAGGRFGVGTFEAIEWLVPAMTNRRMTAEGGGSDKTVIYLVRQQVMEGYSRGYSVPLNIVAQVTVTEHTKEKVGEGDATVFVSGKLVLQFDGFVDITLISK